MKKMGISKSFNEGDSFIISENTPAHTVWIIGDSSAFTLVAVAPAKGLSTLDLEEKIFCKVFDLTT